MQVGDNICHLHFAGCCFREFSEDHPSNLMLLTEWVISMGPICSVIILSEFHHFICAGQLPVTVKPFRYLTALLH